MVGMAGILISIGCGSGMGGLSEAQSVISSPTGTGTPTQSGQTGGVTVTNTHSTPKELGTGDLLYVNLSASSSLDFDGVSQSSEFALVLANTSSSKGNFSVQVSGDFSDAELNISKSVDGEEEVKEEEGSNVTEIFHEVLRLRENEFESLPVVEASFSASKAVSGASADISVGDTRTFKVLSGLTSATSTVDVSAVAECVGSNIVFYVDTRVDNNMLCASDISTLCNQFDATAAKEQQLLGAASDVNNDGKTIVLFTPQVNKLGAQGGGIVTGFFTASDLYPNSASNPSSNYMEILYVMVPDPSGIYGTPISKAFAMSNLLPAVLPHEFQHAISYNQHVLVNKGSAEESWLNEGMSHIAEDIFGQNVENPSRYAIYLANPSAYSLVTGGFPSLAARGASYLFLRYLYEQSENGSQFLSRLDQTSAKGIKNIEQAFAGRSSDFDQFGEFFLRWNAALAMTDAGVTQDRRFVYQARAKDASTGKWSGVCIRCNADDNRGTVLNGTPLKLYSNQTATTAQSAARFFKVAGETGKMVFANVSGGEGYGILIRTK